MKDFLKITSVLLIISAVVSFIVVAIAGVTCINVIMARSTAEGAAVLENNGVTQGMTTYLYISTAVLFVTSLCKLLGGIFGVKSEKDPGLLNRVLILSLLGLAGSVFYEVLSYLSSATMSPLSLVMGVAVPIAVIYAALMVKKSFGKR